MVQVGPNSCVCDVYHKNNLNLVNYSRISCLMIFSLEMSFYSIYIGSIDINEKPPKGKYVLENHNMIVCVASAYYT